MRNNEIAKFVLNEIANKHGYSNWKSKRNKNIGSWESYRKDYDSLFNDDVEELIRRALYLKDKKRKKWKTHLIRR